VSRPFSSWNRPILAEIYLCHACSCHEILRVKTPRQGGEQQQEQEAEPERQRRRQQQSTREG
jgi:hypothetical protein